MANQEHLDILEQGAVDWNIWRQENPDIQPDLSGEEFTMKYFKEFNLRGVDLTEARLIGEEFIGIDLMKANLSKVELQQAILCGANLIEANLSEADLSFAYFIPYGEDAEDLEKPEIGAANLSGANLSKANLAGAMFDGANLSRANLSRANLSGAKFVGADLSGTNLDRANLEAADLTDVDLSRANLSGANLTRAILVRTNMTHTTLTDCRIYGIAAWNVQLEGATQANLSITPENEPTITVDNLKIAQFIYLLLNNKEIRDVINTIGQKGVLILGRFGGGGLEFLHAVAAKLRKMNYLPIIFDFERPDHQDFTETIMTLAGLSRFVIADLSGASVPNELRATIPHFKIPFVPIIEQGEKIYSMFPDLLGYPWVLPPVEFTSQKHMLELLPSRIIEPAEEKFKARQALLNELFNR